jgi:2-C-methyl-D-erythritol 4-phosphate cytidylyltransferase
MKRSVIIVAGGKGLRMGTQMPKQFLSIGGVPVLCRTVNRFLEFDPDIKIFISLPKAYFEVWEKISDGFLSSGDITLVEGGQERFHSVKNALDKVPDDVDFVGVHDGVRPFVSVKVIASAYASAALKGNAVPCIAPPESIRFCEPEGSNYQLDRTKIKLIQTPQVFSLKTLRKAYQSPFNELFTDDASVVEKSGEKINLVDGERQNIKITTFEDLNYAEFLLKK